jgi:hypothetical protein
MGILFGQRRQPTILHNQQFCFGRITLYKKSSKAIFHSFTVCTYLETNTISLHIVTQVFIIIMNIQSLCTADIQYSMC